MSESYVLDASALLCLIQRESGWERVAAMLPNATISSVNLAEVITKLMSQGMSESVIQNMLGLLQCAIAPFKESDAYLSASLRARTRHLGLSLGDHACLALATTRNAIAATTDRAWLEVKDICAVEYVRPLQG
jgi:ribonuclease VapC